MCPVLGFQCHMCVTNSHTCSVGFCIALCVVPALKFWAVQSEACSSTAEYECTSFLRKLCWNYFEIVFTENKLKRKRNENTLSFSKKKRKEHWGVLLSVLECKQVCLMLRVCAAVLLLVCFRQQHTPGAAEYSCAGVKEFWGNPCC